MEILKYSKNYYEALSRGASLLEEAIAAKNFSEEDLKVIALVLGDNKEYLRPVYTSEEG
tara:strand:- start:1795 stop:1971 length:177 start_codon:yes stop_codon:yes gene_type:complete